MQNPSNAILIGFNVRPNKEAKKLAETYKITLKFFNIIYEVLDFINESLSGLLKPDVKEDSCRYQQKFKRFLKFQKLVKLQDQKL